MVLDLAGWTATTPAVPVLRVAPADVAEHSGVPRTMLAGVPLYRRLGFAEVGAWQEWVPAA